MNTIVEDILMHYGMPRRSGRYPYGSGENPYQHSGDFLSRVQELKKSGMSETDIAKNMGLTTTQLRTQMSLAKDERRALQVATAKVLLSALILRRAFGVARTANTDVTITPAAPRPDSIVGDAFLR